MVESHAVASMGFRLALVWGLLALCVGEVASAQKACEGPSEPAKLRELWAFVLKDDSPASIRDLEAAMEKFFAGCKVIRRGYGLTLADGRSGYGFTALPQEKSVFAGYGGWSDWASLDDFKDCIIKGRDSGTLADFRDYAEAVYNAVLPLNTSAGLAALSSSDNCSTTSFAPAKVRYMSTWLLKDPTAAATAIDLQAKTFAKSATVPIRYGAGGDVLVGDQTAHFGTWMDFGSLEEMKAYLAPPAGWAANPSRLELEALATAVTRVAIALPETAPAGTAVADQPPATAAAAEQPPATTAAAGPPPATTTAADQSPATTTAADQSPATAAAADPPPATTAAADKPTATTTAADQSPATTTAAAQSTAATAAADPPPATTAVADQPPATAAAAERAPAPSTEGARR